MNRQLVAAGISADTPMRRAAAAILEAKARPIFKLEAAAKSGKDPEAVHDMRVASRRLREALKIFGPLYRKKTLKKDLGLARAVTRALGPARNCDVAIAFFERDRNEVCDPDVLSAADFVLAQQGKARRREYKRLAQRLGRLNLRRSRVKLYASFQDQRKRMTRSNGHFDPDGGLATNARPLIEERLETMFRHRSAVEDESQTELLHRMRIAAKRLRYAMEALCGAFNQHFDTCYSTVKEIQELLGNIHDHDVFIRMVHELRTRARQKRRTAALTLGLTKLGADLGRRRHELYVEFMAFLRQHDREALTQQVVGALVSC